MQQQQILLCADFEDGYPYHLTSSSSSFLAFSQGQPLSMANTVWLVGAAPLGWRISSVESLQQHTTHTQMHTRGKTCSAVVGAGVGFGQ